jgi:uncharacterized protein (TIGR00299 family) protein
MPERIAWFHCFAGIAGDMALGALLDAGAEVAEVRAIVERLGVTGWQLDAEPTSRNGIAGTRALVTAPEEHHHRRWRDIRQLLEASTLPPRVQQRAHAVFEALAVAEARVHRTTPDEVHFHEVGALDAIVDIVGVAAALEVLDVDVVAAGPVATGTGTVRSSHGILPNPAPAVVELLIGHPVRGNDLPVELTTPTGAAIVAALAQHRGAMPAMTVERSGFGAGARELAELPNLTQVVLGVAAEASARGQEVVLLETNVDDVTGEVLAAAVAALLAAGAHDAWLTSTVMKKGRPAYVVSALVDPSRQAELIQVLQQETGSFGIRATALTRWPAPRQIELVEVLGHPVRLKVGPHRVKAEHDDAHAVAAATGLPVREVLARAEAAWRPRPDA